MCQHLEDLENSVNIFQMINDISKRSIRVQDRQMNFNEKFRKVYWCGSWFQFATNL